MEIDTNRRAWWFKPAALLLILNLCGHLNFVRGACLATDVTAKTLPASLTTMNIDYRHYDATTS